MIAKHASDVALRYEGYPPPPKGNEAHLVPVASAWSSPKISQLTTPCTKWSRVNVCTAEGTLEELGATSRGRRSALASAAPPPAAPCAPDSFAIFVPSVVPESFRFPLTPLALPPVALPPLGFPPLPTLVPLLLPPLRPAEPPAEPPADIVGRRNAGLAFCFACFHIRVHRGKQRSGGTLQPGTCEQGSGSGDQRPEEHLDASNSDPSSPGRSRFRCRSKIQVLQGHSTYTHVTREEVHSTDLAHGLLEKRNEQC